MSADHEFLTMTPAQEARTQEVARTLLETTRAFEGDDPQVVLHVFIRISCAAMVSMGFSRAAAHEYVDRTMALYEEPTPEVPA